MVMANPNLLRNAAAATYEECPTEVIPRRSYHVKKGVSERGVIFFRPVPDRDGARPRRTSSPSEARLRTVASPAMSHAPARLPRALFIVIRFQTQRRLSPVWLLRVGTCSLGVSRARVDTTRTLSLLVPRVRCSPRARTPQRF